MPDYFGKIEKAVRLQLSDNNPSLKLSFRKELETVMGKSKQPLHKVLKFMWCLAKNKSQNESML